MRDVRFPSALAPLAIAAVSFVLLSSPAVRAAKKEKALDKIWTHPEFKSFAIDRIAMLPVATFDGDYQAAGLTENVIGQAVRPTSGYRWIGATTTLDLLRGQPGGDSLLKVIATRLLTVPRVDSLAAQRVCGMLRCDAVLSVRIDLWQQHMPEWNQSGKPNTTVQLNAALVDSLGRLLWTASGSNTMEGPYYDPNAALIGVKVSGLDRKPMMNQAAPPTYREVAAALISRWAPQFPAKPQAAQAASPDSAAAR